MDKKVLTKEEIEKLASLQEEQNQLILGLGNVEYQQNYLEKSKKELHKQLEDLETKQTQVAQELEKKYGRGTVNLENGEFIQA
jgi:chromosome segregation ATPase